VRHRRGRFAQQPPPPPPEGQPALGPGDLKRLRQLQAEVERNPLAVAAARIHPRLRRGKKCPPMCLVPPRPTDPKKIRSQWGQAAMIAEIEADNSEDE
jgi:hypothetical protein